MIESDTAPIPMGNVNNDGSGFSFIQWLEKVFGFVWHLHPSKQGELSQKEEKDPLEVFLLRSKPSPLMVRARNFVEKHSLVIMASSLLILIILALLWWKKEAILRHRPQGLVAQVERFFGGTAKSKISEPPKVEATKKVDKKQGLAAVVVAQGAKDLSQPVCPPDCYPPEQLPNDVAKKTSQVTSPPVVPQKSSAQVPGTSALPSTAPKSAEVTKVPVPQPKVLSVPESVVQPVVASTPKPKAQPLPVQIPKVVAKKVSVPIHDIYACARRSTNGTLMHVNCVSGMPVVLPNNDITCKGSTYFLRASEKVCYGVQG